MIQSTDSARPNILIPDPMGGDPEFLLNYFAEHYSDLNPQLATDERDLRKRIPEADAVILNLMPFDAELISQMHRCQVIARLGSGTDNIDMSAATKMNIVVSSIQNYCTEEVSDHVLALALALARKLPQANADMHNQKWNQLGYRPIRQFKTLKIGLVGFGTLARGVAKKFMSLGMDVMAYDPYVEPAAHPNVVFADLPTVFADSDILSLHAPLTPETEAMINTDSIKTMKKGAFLINAARGGLVDETAIVDALNTGHLRGVALDVFAQEPLAGQSTLINRSDVLLTPHLAFYSEQSLERMQSFAADEVARVLSGEAAQGAVNNPGT